MWKCTSRRNHPRIHAILNKSVHLRSSQLGQIHATTHRIDLIPVAIPFNPAPCRSGPRPCKPEEFEINHRLQAGVIEQSNAECSVPANFAPKKDGQLRLFEDYRKLNKMTIKYSYLLTRIDECISPGKSHILCTWDELNGYWLINIAKKDRHETYFVCHSGRFQYIFMPLVLTISCIYSTKHSPYLQIIMRSTVFSILPRYLDI